jgi:hypothetical protein
MDIDDGPGSSSANSSSKLLPGAPPKRLRRVLFRQCRSPDAHTVGDLRRSCSRRFSVPVSAGWKTGETGGDKRKP